MAAKKPEMKKMKAKSEMKKEMPKPKNKLEAILKAKTPKKGK